MIKKRKHSGGYVGEIFSSFQGEGIYLGLKQIFVRFMGCSVNCVFCDTPYSRMDDGFCSVEKEPGSRKFLLIPNPLSPFRLNKFINKMEMLNPGHHSISITGGEPLEQWRFLTEWLPTLSKKKKVYLETNGIMPAALEKVLRHIDIIAMDIKLLSSTRRNPFWAEHAEFLKLSLKREVFVKVVITARTDKYEVLKAALMVGKIKRNLPFVLQPASQYGTFRDIPNMIFLRELQVECSKILRDVRVIPQVQKVMGIS